MDKSFVSSSFTISCYETVKRVNFPQSIINLTQNCELVSPLVLPYEIGNALSAMFKRDRLTKVQIIDSFDIYNKIPVRLLDVDIKVALQIASDFSIYAYDAYYLEIAKRFKFNLLTLDKKMMSIASGMGIHVLEVQYESF